MPRVQINDAQRIFKLEIMHQLNKPVVVKAWSDYAINQLSVDGTYMIADSSVMVDKRCVTSFLSNCDYKSQLKNQLMDFVCLGFSFAPDFIVNSNNVQLLCGIGDQYIFDSKNVTKVQFKENIYKGVKIEFEASWDYLHQGFDVVHGYINTYDVEKLKKKIPTNGDYKKIRVLNSNLREIASHLVCDADDVFKMYTCDVTVDYQYFCSVLRSESLIIEAEQDIANKQLIKNIEYKFKIPHKPGLKNWIADTQYYKFDIVWHDSAAYRARKDNKASEFDESAWEKINKKQYLSFNHEPSFFATKHGSSCFAKIHQAIPFLIEKNIGDSVTLVIVDAQSPKLNGWFEFNGKKFRVVKYTQHCGTFDFVEIFGQEILQTDLNHHITADRINWENDDVMPVTTYDLVSAPKNSVDGKFEGVVINVPDDFVVASNSKLKIKVGE